MVYCSSLVPTPTDGYMIKVQEVEPVGYSQISFFHLHHRSSSLISCPSWDQQLRQNSPSGDPYFYLLIRFLELDVKINKWNSNPFFFFKRQWKMPTPNSQGPRLVPRLTSYN